MYRQHFGMTGHPFGPDIAIDQLHQWRTFGEAKARLSYLFELGGIGLLTGEVGAAKTTSVRAVTQQLHPDLFHVLYLANTTGSVTDLYRSVAHHLGIEAPDRRSVLHDRIHDELLRLNQTRRIRPIMVLDEAQQLTNALLHEVCVMSNFQMDSKPFLTVLLCGQSPLRVRLNRSSNEPLNQRVVMRYHMDGMDANEVSPYLQHHLRRVKAPDNIFSPAAIEAIYRASQGLARRINRLAEQTLIAAAAARETMITAEHVRLAVAEVDS